MRLGNILDLMALREVMGDVMCLKHPKKAGARIYKALIEVNSINFSLMTEGEQEATMEGFRTFLNGLNYEIAIHIRIEPYDLEPYLQQISDSTTPFTQEIAEDHTNFVLSLAAQRALLQRRFYIVVPCEETTKNKSKEEIFDDARTQLELRSSALTQDLERMGLTAQRLRHKDIVRYYHSCMNSEYAKSYPLADGAIESANDIIHSSVHTKGNTASSRSSGLPDRYLNMGDYSTMPPPPQGKGKKEQPVDVVRLSEVLAPSSLEVKRTYIRTRNVYDEYMRVFAVTGYPGSVKPGWLDRLIQIDEPSIDIALYIKPLDATTYTTQLSGKLTSFRASQLLDDRHGRTVDPYVKAGKENVEELREKLVRQEEHVFSFALYIMVRASSLQQLKEKTHRLNTLLRSLELVATETTFEHERGWQCLLPEGNDVLKRRKVLDTSSIITAFPFASSSLSTSTGILTGIMPNGSLVILDPFSEQLENANEVKFAKSGAGKSYDGKVRAIRSLLAGIAVCVIDPESEYERECRKFNGDYIRLSSGALQLNPFDLYATEEKERNILEEKFQSLHTLCDLLLADRPGSLSQREKGYLNKCFYRVYAKRNISPDQQTHSNPPPTMEDLYDVIRNEECGPDTFELADRLQRFVPLFPKRTTVTLDNDLQAFSIRDLDTEMRPIGLFLITEFVWTQMRRKRTSRKKRLLIIDEAWSLLQFAEGGRFLANIARRARKYDLGLITITQDVEDFLSSEWGRTILVNSSIKVLMKQDSSTIDSVVHAFHLSDSDRKFLLSCAKGQALLFARGSHVPLQVVASQFEHKLAHTSQRELFEELEEQRETEQRAFEEAERVRNAVVVSPREDEQYQVILPQYFVHSESKSHMNGHSSFNE